MFNHELSDDYSDQQFAYWVNKVLDYIDSLEESDRNTELILVYGSRDPKYPYTIVNIGEFIWIFERGFNKFTMELCDAIHNHYDSISGIAALYDLPDSTQMYYPTDEMSSDFTTIKIN